MGDLDVAAQLELSLLWNRSDMTDQILRNNKNFKDEIIEKLFTKSLIENKIECIKIFAELIDLENFLTKAKLGEIYQETLRVSNESFLRDILELKEGKRHLENLLSDIQLKPEKILRVIQLALQLLTNIEFTKKSSKESGTEKFKNPEHELFVYSLLFIRLETSEFFWENMLCKTSSAVFAVLISKSILNSSSVRGDRNLHARVQNMHENYERQAKGVLNSCYVNSVERCQTIITVEHESWGSKNCIELAIQADCKEFIAHSGCQTLLKKVWRGVLYDNPVWKIIGATIIPFLVLLVVYKEDVIKERAKRDQGRWNFALQVGTSKFPEV